MAKAEFADYPREVMVAMGAYKELVFSHIGVLEAAFRVPFKNLYQAYHPLTAPDRLINGTKFPIGISFGERDFMGTEGADQVILTNAYYSSGQSQLFVIPNTGHPSHVGNPEALVETIVGFFNGTISGKFEQKARENSVLPKQKNYPKL